MGVSVIQIKISVSSAALAAAPSAHIEVKHDDGLTLDEVQSVMTCAADCAEQIINARKAAAKA